jgi:hypothetical protein
MNSAGPLHPGRPPPGGPSWTVAAAVLAPPRAQGAGEIADDAVLDLKIILILLVVSVGLCLSGLQGDNRLRSRNLWLMCFQAAMQGIKQAVEGIVNLRDFASFVLVSGCRGFRTFNGLRASVTHSNCFNLLKLTMPATCYIRAMASRHDERQR